MIRTRCKVTVCKKQIRSRRAYDYCRKCCKSELGMRRVIPGRKRVTRPKRVKVSKMAKGKR